MKALKSIILLISILLMMGTCLVSCATKIEDPLPSWTDGPTKSAIIAFVEHVSTPGSSDFVPEPERIAVFDNDGTLWSEQPMYFQLIFALDRVKELAPQHPEWQEKQPFKAVLEGDIKAVMLILFEQLALSFMSGWG